MISVCMATYNGEAFLREQIDSILLQLSEEDELVISDDNSTDSTADIIKSYHDKKIRFLVNKRKKGVTHNFENALIHSKGDVILLADQDDVWLPNKIEELTQFLTKGDYDVVTCNCALTDINLNITQDEYYVQKSPLDKSVWGNFVKDLWLGSCMAFKRKVLLATLPFPSKMAAHDLWIALFSQIHFKCGYYPKVLQLYRRHEHTVSFAGAKSTNSLWYKINYRFYLAFFLLIRSLTK
ncbi:glycosyltransferase [Bacteroides helcogenes]|uniref:Glycosyl transferase family 2 n=1 Tax=Bacteroides helcogenes (strain ATCC 35417 / DSM 20613 / JCM 6297 / CCUG 15421 / P 36-108) TaxID=693979 RepID=E6SVV5_BACT6|nr:glycosyl transferase family 2 [Bacteroides helcogenes P 36-108]